MLPQISDKSERFRVLLAPTKTVHNHFMKKPKHHPKIQHYVPKMLLRNFAFGKKTNPKTHVFDKHRGEAGEVFPHPTSIRKIAAEKGFYDFDVGDVTASIEGGLALLEGRTAAAFEKLLGAPNLTALSDKDRAWISIFVASQFVRGRHFRESMKQIDEDMKQLIRNMGHDPNDVEGWAPFEDENDIKAFASLFILRSSKEYSAVIASKAWVLMETDPAEPFWIGDNPVAMHNDEDFGPYGNIGLAVPSIQIYLPLSPTLTLAMWCPTMVQKILDEIEEGQKIINTAKMQRLMMPNVNRHEIDTSIKQLEMKLRYSMLFKNGIETGEAVRCVPDNVIFMNSLQSAWAYRFVMSNKRDFKLAARQIREFPQLRKGRPLKVS